MMDANQGGPEISGSWTHSYEEDSGDVQTYRPTHSFAFPPSRRGRETLEFGAAGQMVSGRPGPDDRLQMSSASLTALGMNRFRLDGMGMPGRVVEIIDARPDILKVRFS
ncbi:hypothetical protein [Janthinobacterium fluminis]|uniref:Uncharacterized protein n=1 Tax=Janthinobacterium fluminis TaxID=2987524 RepID=A0ABT5JWC8_9BURK|nr:hypothetical protein [Janthinobacterium fluminis]MDC8756735.1 hypothetical protein [Janthinobacterium fluminis]